MRDSRYEKELEKFENEINMIVNAESKLINNDICLFIYRHKLKKLILTAIVDKDLLILSDSHEQTKDLKEYRSFILQTKRQYPSFIFDDYDIDKFKKCIELKNQGYKLEQIEEYYLNELCETTGQKLYKKTVERFND